MQLLLQPLVDEMRLLTLVGIHTYDCYKKVDRQLHASLLRTTADLPARAKVTKGQELLFLVTECPLSPLKVQQQQGHTAVYGCLNCKNTGQRVGHTYDRRIPRPHDLRASEDYFSVEVLQLV